MYVFTAFQSFRGHPVRLSAVLSPKVSLKNKMNSQGFTPGYKEREPCVSPDPAGDSGDSKNFIFHSNGFLSTAHIGMFPMVFSHWQNFRIPVFMCIF